MVRMPFIGLIAALAFVPAESFAKRLPPKPVEPFIHDGVKYIAPHFDLSFERDQIGGFVEAWDIQSGTKLWDLKVYRVEYDPRLERDVQDVFITSLSLEEGDLIVQNGRGEEFEIDLESRAVTRRTALSTFSHKYRNVKYVLMCLAVVVLGVVAVLVIWTRTRRKAKPI